MCVVNVLFSLFFFATFFYLSLYLPPLSPPLIPFHPLFSLSLSLSFILLGRLFYLCVRGEECLSDEVAKAIVVIDRVARLLCLVHVYYGGNGRKNATIEVNENRQNNDPMTMKDSRGGPGHSKHHNRIFFCLSLHYDLEPYLLISCISLTNTNNH